MAARFHTTPQLVADHWPISQCFALAAWTRENDPWCPMQCTGDSYVAQERQRLLGLT